MVNIYIIIYMLYIMCEIGCGSAYILKKNVKSINQKTLIKGAVILALAALVIYCSFTLVSNYADISRLKAQAVEYEAEYSQQVEENEKVKAILESDNMDDYIEQKAREKGYAKDDEMVFYDISSSK